MNRKEVIQALKDSKTCPAFWTDEMWEVAKELSSKGIEYLCPGLVWKKKQNDFEFDRKDYTSIYRLSHDYTEPEEGEIIEIKLETNNCFLTYSGWAYTSAPALIRWNGYKVSFAGYKYADGTITTEPVLATNILKKMCEPYVFEFPVSVLFRRTVE